VHAAFLIAWTLGFWALASLPLYLFLEVFLPRTRGKGRPKEVPPMFIRDRPSA